MSKDQYHTFLSHNGEDKATVEKLAHRLKQAGIRTWLDKWNLMPGTPWQPAIEEALAGCDTCTVCIGPSGLGPWQNEEMRAAIRRRVDDKSGEFRVIPVLLPSTRRPKRSRLPTFLSGTTWVEFRNSLDEEDAFRRLVWGIQGTKPIADSEQASYEGVCPYRGLQTFQTKHTAFFFGREALTEWLCHELRSAPISAMENRFLAIIGASGSGKSSLALAGLVPAIKRGELDSSQEWPIVILRPDYEPVESLAVALFADSEIGKSVSSMRALMSEIVSDERTLHLMIRAYLHNMPETRRVVVLVDQFEEIFTLCNNDSHRRAFIENLLYASSVAHGRTVVVLTIRADFYSKCAGYSNLATALSDHQVLVGPLTEEELRRAIECPAQLVGCELETGLTELLIQDVTNQAGALPLLQYALSELWERREGRRLTLAAYHDMGGLAGALERRANEIFDGLDETEKEICQRIFLRLTQPGEGTEDTKRRATLQELFLPDRERSTFRRVIQTLTAQRLIIMEGDEDHAEGGLVEIAHEALIRGWSKLRMWIDSDREALRVHRRLSDAAMDWHKHKEDDDESFLYRGVRLAEAEEWSHAHADRLNSLELEYLQASIKLRDKERTAEQSRQKQLQRRAVIAMAAGAVAVMLMIVASVLFLQERKIARQRVEELRKYHSTNLNVTFIMFLDAWRTGDKKRAAASASYIPSELTQGKVIRLLSDPNTPAKVKLDENGALEEAIKGFVLGEFRLRDNLQKHATKAYEHSLAAIRKMRADGDPFFREMLKILVQARLYELSIDNAK